MEYQVVVKFDDLNCTEEGRKKYFSVVDKYHALSFNNSKYRILTLVINQNEPLDEKILAQDLGGLEILSFRQSRKGKNKNLEFIKI